jgi:acyl dehydratase
MPINPDAVGSRGEPFEHSWDEKDCMLYALGVGAGTEELAFTTENTRDVTLQALPTMPVVLSSGGFGALRTIGDFNPAMLVHGEQRVELFGPLPTTGTVRNVGEVTAIWDKGKGAVVELAVTGTDVATEAPLFTATMALFIRGEGGFGGERGPSGPRNVAPDSAPDAEVSQTTSPDQALLYRLSGDRNPLHSDPSFAALGGFDRPILHGLCTYGFAGRALLHELCGSDPGRMRSMEGRFSASVFPGETLTTRVWRATARRCSPRRPAAQRRATGSCSTAVGSPSRPDRSRGQWPGPGGRLEQPEVVDAHPPQVLVVDFEPVDPARLSEHFRLRLDDLGHEQASNVTQVGVPGEALEIAAELLDAVDLTPPLHLNGHGVALGVAAQQVHRSDVGGVLPSDQHHARSECRRVGGEEFLEVGLHAVLAEPGVGAEVVVEVGHDVVEGNGERLALGVRHHPPPFLLDERVGGVHPVERFVGPAVGVDGDTAIGLDHDESKCGG